MGYIAETMIRVLGMLFLSFPWSVLHTYVRALLSVCNVGSCRLSPRAVKYFYCCMYSSTRTSTLAHDTLVQCSDVSAENPQTMNASCLFYPFPHSLSLSVHGTLLVFVNSDFLSPLLTQIFIFRLSRPAAASFLVSKPLVLSWSDHNYEQRQRGR